MPIKNLLDIMARLRSPQSGCPWDREQDFATIAPYTIEEAYEVADAIALDDMPGLRSELGDLLFQVVFHARLAEEAGHFDFDDVVAGICDKLTRRHPHVFGDAEVPDASEQAAVWERIKASEKPAGQGVLHDVPVGLPALTRSFKLGRRAATVGFDWPDFRGVRLKITEELDELDDALARGDTDAAAGEIGDVFFALVNACRHLNVDPEACLRATNRRFQRRFEHLEAAVERSGRAWSTYGADELEGLWSAAKAALG